MDDRNNFSNEKYLAARDRLVERNEDFINNIYLDIKGLPTVGIGVLLVNRQKDRSWELNYSRVNLLADIANISELDRKNLVSTLEKYTDTLDKHRDEKYQTLASFRKSNFGKEAQVVLGPISFGKNGKSSSWDIFTSEQSKMKFFLTREQTLELYNKISPEYENTLDNEILKTVNCPQEALSEEQRAGLYSMVYHGSTGKARRVADAIGDYWRGEISENMLRSRIEKNVMDAKFPIRSENELKYMEKIKERPQKHSMEKSDTNLAELDLSPTDKLQALIQGFKNDKDGTFTAKALADNADVVANFRDELRESLKQNQAQEVAQNTPQVQEERSYGGRSFG